jgi:hypothetical protein
VPVRNWWTYFYNRNVTGYVEDANTLMSPGYCAQFAGPNDGFTPRNVRYVNWRFVMSNNTAASPPVAPSLSTFTLAWRYTRVQ